MDFIVSYKDGRGKTRRRLMKSTDRQAVIETIKKWREDNKGVVSEVRLFELVQVHI